MTFVLLIWFPALQDQLTGYGLICTQVMWQGWLDSNQRAGRVFPALVGVKVRCLTCLATALCIDAHHAGFPPHGTSRLSEPSKKQEVLLEAIGAGDGNRTRVACLEGRCSTIELHRRIAMGAQSRSPMAACLSRLSRQEKRRSSCGGAR